jgi:hypothetical protein
MIYSDRAFRLIRTDRNTEAPADSLFKERIRYQTMGLRRAVVKTDNNLGILKVNLQTKQIEQELIIMNIMDGMDAARFTSANPDQSPEKKKQEKADKKAMPEPVLRDFNNK